MSKETLADREILAAEPSLPGSRRGRAGRGRAIALSLAAAFATAAAVCGLLARQAEHRRAELLSRATRALESEIGARHSALEARVRELAATPRLAAALATDVATVRDLMGQELAFRAHDGETITLEQSFHDGRRVRLLAVPPDADFWPGRAGDETSLVGNRLALSRVAAIAPSERSEEIVGLLAVRHAIGVPALTASLPKQLDGARMVVDGQTLALGLSPPSSSSRALVQSLSLPGEPQASLALAADTSARSLAALAVVLALLGGAFGVRAILSTRARARASSASLSLDSVDVADGPDTDLAVASARAAPTPSAVEPSTAASAGFAHTEASPAPAEAGERRVGRYVLLRRLGQGGMADVHLARAEGEAGFGKLVAFKVLQTAFAAHPVAVDLFLDEARLVAGLDHPNIVQTYDLGRAGESYFLAMEYVDGIDLARLIGILQGRGDRVPVPFALAILCKICDGLHAAHTAKGPDGQPLHLVHRDVKGANVFLSRAGVVKVGDFGIAKASHSLRMSHTEMGQVKGTPGYMAPEQRLGMEVDARADIYGVGCIAYEMLSGQVVNLDYVALAARGIRGWPHLAPLGSLRSDVPGDLDAIVRTALAYAREERFSDCAALEQAFRTVGSSTGIARDKDIGDWVRRHIDEAPDVVRRASS